MEKKKVSKKEMARIDQKSHLILEEMEVLIERINRGSEFSYSGYSCGWDRASTKGGIHKQIVMLRAALLELDRMIGGVKPW